ncbi:MAG: substrate-binding domain-containing protein [Agathobacter sp.]|nr:substrate-binding domain-containing protein [Agathobacter sp.]
MRALKSLSIVVPTDVMVCGFDNSPESTIIEPPLTTVRIPSSSMGYTAADMLLSRIEHPQMPYRTTYIRTEVKYRASTDRKHI